MKAKKTFSASPFVLALVHIFETINIAEQLTTNCRLVRQCITSLT